MNCQEFWDQAPGDRQALHAASAAHLEVCPACASAWEARGDLAAGLRRVAEGWSHLEAPARLEARLVKAFREQAGLAAVPRPRPWIAALAWGSAAVTVLALAISLIRVHEPQTATPRPAPANAVILAALEEGTEAGGFVPLPNVEQLGPSEQGDVVRVELPRSAMIAVGFEVSPERAAEPVEAEVMFGPDGVARAVRFLDGTF